MKRICLPFLIAVSSLVNAQEINIIPKPAEISMGKGEFLISPSTSVYTNNKKLSGCLKYLNEYLQKNYGFKLSETKNYKQKGIIILDVENIERTPKGAYYLRVADNITIGSEDNEGVFYGIQTLIQIISSGYYTLYPPLSASGKSSIRVSHISITDYPRFQYRGMHLDVCRHFFPVSFVKQYIDYLALHKLNKFHWHLTEDQGWRIQIKKYPKLTEIGGWRNGTIIGRYPGKGNDNIYYGGFYTQDEIKEVVRYAAERFIEVIPEIEMPGHGSAAIAAYPWLSCFPEKPTEIPANMISKKSVEEQKNGRIKLVQETWGVFNDIFCAGKDSTFMFLQNVIDEVVPLFPSKYFHIGGDEAPKVHWKKCPRCQQRIKELGLKDEHELQSYFVQRIEKYLNSKGKTLIGWDEILEGGLAPNAVVMSWRGIEGGIDAAKQNHDVIMTPGNPVYFDHTQSENEDSVTIGGYNPIEKVYAYDPVPAALNSEQSKHILGAQANLWTEYIGNTKKAEYMIFPRMAALSEVLWSSNEKKDWNDFEKRLMTQFKRYDLWKVNYSKAYFDLKTKVVPTENYNGVIWELRSKYAKDICQYCSIVTKESFTYKKDTILIDTIVRYDIHDPTRIIDYKYEKTTKRKGEIGFTISPHYNNEDTLAKIFISDTKTMSAWQGFHHTKGPEIEQQFHFNKATGKKITLTTEASSKYPGDGAFTLVNGVQNEKGMARSKEFLGFSGTDCEAVIDLGKEEEISIVKAHILEQKGSWIYRPSSITISVSDDGKNFTSVACSNPTITDKEALCEFLEQAKARYIKIRISNYGTIPDGSPGAGNKAWLFIDEIEVN
ncbi:MAG TPA: family 20 glycosylhydrolase [Chitinophagaceae bacterium]|nr:family 20 glycosylhydrolase [Chitinophagaceae bacterium]